VNLIIATRFSYKTILSRQRIQTIELNYTALAEFHSRQKEIEETTSLSFGGIYCLYSYSGFDQHSPESRFQ